MSRPFTPKVLTANDLIEGDAVWLTADETWSRDMADAELLEDEAVAQERLIFSLTQSDVVVGAYLVDAEASPAGPVPVHFRETFRTRGPSNYAHGKQVGA
ncbi:MAG: DUF2849 domain-containing protein [Boseongicola sp.]|nr:DUF2849 domain-containing protein [Boseongicola sp.]NNL18402.1 DUF2849 domain-containing protein [Boseongicola sp.]